MEDIYNRETTNTRVRTHARTPLVSDAKNPLDDHSRFVGDGRVAAPRQVGRMFLHLAVISLGDSLGEVVKMYDDTRSPALTLLFYFAWVIVSLVLLLNLLGDLPLPWSPLPPPPCIGPLVRWSEGWPKPGQAR